MSANWGTNIEVSIFGESHGKGVGINIGKLPAGVKLDLEMIIHEMNRRKPGKNAYTTTRKEDDEFEILSGYYNGYTTGAPLCIFIKNTSQHSQDYDNLLKNMRPGHSDYPAYIKYKGFNDVRGGGHFSARITAAIVFAGSVCKQILKEKGIEVCAHVASIKDVKDEKFPLIPNSQLFDELRKKEYPVISDEAYEKMKATITDARKRKESVGGDVEVIVTGLKAGIGNPFFDSVESRISQLMFSVPAVKSISFGDLEDITMYDGSYVNDQYYYDENGNVKTKTNHNGGILGGITNGMPVLFRVKIKPTSSVSVKQESINVETKENVEMVVVGRHDPCLVLRGSVVVEAMTAIAIMDLVNV